MVSKIAPQADYRPHGLTDREEFETISCPSEGFALAYRVYRICADQPRMLHFIQAKQTKNLGVAPGGSGPRVGGPP